MLVCVLLFVNTVSNTLQKRFKQLHVPYQPSNLASTNNPHTGGKNTRGIRVSSYDPDDPTSQQACGGTGTSGGGVNADGSSQQSKTLGNQRKFMPGSQRVATISQHYNEKTMLLSSDDEYQ